jgi:hypothetical protein
LIDLTVFSVCMQTAEHRTGMEAVGYNAVRDGESRGRT